MFAREKETQQSKTREEKEDEWEEVKKERKEEMEKICMERRKKPKPERKYKVKIGDGCREIES